MNHTLQKLLVAVIRFKGFEGRARALWGVVREFAPYAAIELILPGGTLVAILCWLYRRRTASRRKSAALDASGALVMG